MLRYPGNRGIMFRRVYPSLERPIIPPTIAMTQGWGTYDGQKHTFTFTNGHCSRSARCSTRTPSPNPGGVGHVWVKRRSVTGPPA